MTMARRAVVAFGAALLMVAANGAEAPQGAIDTVPGDWRIVHCGFSRGVLYVTYVGDDKPAIVPAFPNAAVLRACADAGFALAASAPRRTPALPRDPRIAVPSPPPRPVPPAAPARPAPTFVANAVGNTLTIDARNDSSLTYRCTVDFAWTADDTTAPQSVTTQATLPPHQATRVASIAGHGNVRVVSPPRVHCTPG
jgi:hypothetical protein